MGLALDVARLVVEEANRRARADPWDELEVPTGSTSRASRRRWCGRWTGRLSDTGLAREFNPERGFIATASNNAQPPDYTLPLMFKRVNPNERMRRRSGTRSRTRRTMT